jgi:hypothetical protein
MRVSHITKRFGTICLLAEASVLALLTTTSRAQQQQCAANQDCEDYNACTTDTCDRGGCVHTPTNAGGACGLGINDDCTNPDTCDADGHCLPNNAPDGTGCFQSGFGGGFCTAGLCAPTVFRATLLPEDGNIGSEPSDGSFLNGDPDRPVIVGHVFNNSSIAKAAAWQSTDGGQTFSLQNFPTPVLGI